MGGRITYMDIAVNLVLVRFHVGGHGMWGGGLRPICGRSLTMRSEPPVPHNRTVTMLDRELAAPPIAKSPSSREVLRVWAADDGPQQVSLETTWAEPEAWGLLLADVARHTAKAYAALGHSEADALMKIVDLFTAEIASPTDNPIRL